MHNCITQVRCLTYIHMYVPRHMHVHVDLHINNVYIIMYMYWLTVHVYPDYSDCRLFMRQRHCEKCTSLISWSHSHYVNTQYGYKIYLNIRESHTNIPVIYTTKYIKYMYMYPLHTCTCTCMHIWLFTLYIIKLPCVYYHAALRDQLALHVHVT